MFCYRCNGTLDLKSPTCPRCAADVRMFKRIVYASNRAYNEGLLKARARGLSGAREALRRSLQLYKKNVDARNLLGLVYYAMGEPSEGLKEWIISRNTRPNQNLADRFISNLRRSMKELDSENHGIIKFNQALNYAKGDAKDLATIQLKKVISVHPNMVKAYELLALLYIEDKKFDQAKKILERCLKVDRGSAAALYYLSELSELSKNTEEHSMGIAGESEREQLIIPVRFRDFGSYLANLLYILGGLIVGIGIAWFVLVPGKVQKEVGDVAETAKAYESVISELQESIALYESEKAVESQSVEESIAASESESIAASESEAEESSKEAALTETLPDRSVETEWVTNQDLIAKAVAAVNADDHVTTVDAFMRINPTMVSDSYQQSYRDLVGILFNPAYTENLTNMASAMINEGRYPEAAALWSTLCKLHPEHAGFREMAALCYENAGNIPEACNAFYLVANFFPGTNEAMEAVVHYQTLRGKAVPRLPDGVNVSDFTAPISGDVLLQSMSSNQ